MNRRQREAMAGLHAEIGGLQGRLAADINALTDGGDMVCRQALSDAAERNNAAGAVLSGATTPAELTVARQILVEGLQATRLVRQRQDLPLGADLPDLSAVSEPTTVRYGDQEHVAHPDYHPSRPHFFGGSPQAPAGYYARPWWKTALALGGAVVGAEMLGDVVSGVFDGDRDFGGGGDFGGGDFGGGDSGGDW